MLIFAIYSQINIRKVRVFCTFNCSSHCFELDIVYVVCIKFKENLHLSPHQFTRSVYPVAALFVGHRVPLHRLKYEMLT